MHSASTNRFVASWSAGSSMVTAPTRVAVVGLARSATTVVTSRDASSAAIVRRARRTVATPAEVYLARSASMLVTTTLSTAPSRATRATPAVCQGRPPRPNGGPRYGAGSSGVSGKSAEQAGMPSPNPRRNASTRSSSVPWSRVGSSSAEAMSVIITSMSSMSSG